MILKFEEYIQERLDYSHGDIRRRGVNHDVPHSRIESPLSGDYNINDLTDEFNNSSDKKVIYSDGILGFNIWKVKGEYGYFYKLDSNYTSICFRFEGDRKKYMPVGIGKVEIQFGDQSNGILIMSFDTNTEEIEFYDSGYGQKCEEYFNKIDKKIKEKVFSDNEIGIEIWKIKNIYLLKFDHKKFFAARNRDAYTNYPLFVIDDDDSEWTSNIVRVKTGLHRIVNCKCKQKLNFDSNTGKVTKH